jgi:hypothetical protein
MPHIHVLMAEIQRPAFILADTPVERHDAVVRGVGSGIILVVFEEETCAAEPRLQVFACAEERAVVDCYFERLVLARVVEAGWRRGLGRGEEEDGGPGAVLAFDVVWVVGCAVCGCVKGLEG